MTKDEAILELIQVVIQIKPKSAGEHEYLSILMHEAEALTHHQTRENENE